MAVSKFRISKEGDAAGLNALNAVHDVPHGAAILPQPARTRKLYRGCSRTFLGSRARSIAVLAAVTGVIPDARFDLPASLLKPDRPFPEAATEAALLSKRLWQNVGEAHRFD
jgi:hypothetical protein